MYNSDKLLESNNVKIIQEFSVSIKNKNRMCYFCKYIFQTYTNYILLRFNIDNNLIVWGLHINYKNNLNKFTDYFLNDDLSNNKKKEKIISNCYIFNTKERCLDYVMERNYPEEVINSIIANINLHNSYQKLSIINNDENIYNSLEEYIDDNYILEK